MKCKALVTAAIAAFLVSGLALAQGVPDIMAPGAKPSGTTPRPTAATAAAAGNSSGSVDPVQQEQTTLSFVDELKMKGSSDRIRARLSDVIRVTDPQLREKITVNGSVRYEDAGGGKTKAIVNWTSVAREDANRRKVLGQALESRFSAEAAVPSGQSVSARGDVDGLLNAARSLLDDDKKTDEKATQTTKSEATQAPTASRPATAGGAGASQNPLVTSQLPVTARTAETPVAAQAADVLGESTSGCTAKVDLTQAVVIVQSQVTTNGTPSGECSDTATRYPILKSYSVCTDKVDATAKKAFTQFKSYYVAGDGSTTYIDTECKTDSEKFYAFSDDYAACTHDVDLTSLKAYLRAETVYTNANGQRVVVNSCQRTAGAPIVMTKSESSCTPRLDMVAMVAYQRMKTTYSYNSLLYTPQDCTDTALTYGVTEDRTVCTDLVDQTSGQAWPQHRYVYTDSSGTKQYADSACTPITAEGQSLVKERCTGASYYVHDLTAGQSFGMSNWYYKSFADHSTKIYVSSCTKDTSIVFAHQTRINGYVNDDTTRTAKPKTEIYFSDAGDEVIVSAAQIRAGAPDLPYSLTSANVTVADGTTIQVGCETHQNTALHDVYTRPDSTQLTVSKGAGTPIVIPGTLLAGGTHTDVNCCGVGGAMTSIGNGNYVCKISGTNCPSGWAQYQNWTTTMSVIYSGAFYTPYLCGVDASCGSCVTSTGNTNSHAFSNIAVESVSAVTDYSCGGRALTYSLVLERGCQ